MNIHWIALNSVNGLGPVRIRNLVEAFGSPEAVIDAPIESLTTHIPRSAIEQLKCDSLLDLARRQIETASHLDCRIITLDDNEYPQYLKEIYAPPPVLYTKGNLSIFSNCAIAIVGSRTPTVYGKTVTQQLSRELVERGICIVSGLALGIDTIAHETALQHAGKTIAVLGCGIDRVYPRSNTPLAAAIANSGIIISEFPFGTAPESFNFPRRNRIISGCSAGSVIVEASEKSGSLITAHYALQQGRDVYAVPGSIHSPLSRGTFNLILEGATPVRSGYDIADALQQNSAPRLNLNQHPALKLPIHLLSETEKEVYSILSSDPVRIDTLKEQSTRSINELFDILLNLELKGFIRQLNGQQFIKEPN